MQQNIFEDIEIPFRINSFLGVLVFCICDECIFWFGSYRRWHPPSPVRCAHMKAFSIAWIFKWLTLVSVSPRVVHIKDALIFHEKLRLRRRQSTLLPKIIRPIVLCWLISAARTIQRQHTFSFIDSFRYPFSEFLPPSPLRRVVVYHISTQPLIGCITYVKMWTNARQPAAISGKWEKNLLRMKIEVSIGPNNLNMFVIDE